MKEPVFLKFPIAKKARERYGLDEKLFSIPWSMTFSGFQFLYEFANRINERRNLSEHPEQAVKTGLLNGAGLINEILHYVMGYYRQKNNPDGFEFALDWARGRNSPLVVERVLTSFVDKFPPLPVQRGEQLAIAYLQGRLQDRPNHQIAAEEVLLLYLANENPAFSSFCELFDDTDLEREVRYENLIRAFEEFFSTQPPVGPNNNSLVNMLREPVLASPDSISGQLDYIRKNWSSILPQELMYRLLLVQDIIKEEEKVGFLGPGPSQVPTFGRGMYEYAELEQFTRDKDWMPRVVLLAKIAHVWLDQLSKKYRRHIRTLDQIPDEELDNLAKWGFSGLWLIGLWQRSPASQRIKQLCGNPEAHSSAYSIYDYVIAEDLGGESALENLRNRAWQRGIRLSCDMVPNHMGIYSKWILDHPDYFLQLDHSAYPSYSFTGENLSLDSKVGLYIEDGYWDRRDAAVVFKYVDHWTGQVSYIYHGNDGTSTPWNDTAQLNFLQAEVREAVIQLILYIARKFPIIRFDAAMTLTKKHYQRLWFPQPGTGGDIPSRSGRGLSQEEFERAFPKEFWREVVDRIKAEGLDTLLIAEAFWLMEGFFVRTLGMHRVYNSAFMNMLKMEENAKYRSVIKNVLEFNPEILRRFVNFMSNPDEETAMAQFGKGDKYFGVAIMMVTMPGLPMFGHGQIEAYTEKYGMEYRKAYWHEEVDWNQVRRHEVEVFPLMKRRHLFSGVENFFLFDFYGVDGKVNENVFAFSNYAGEERALVLYHNRYETAKGWIRISAAASVESGRGGERILVQKSLAAALGLHTDGRHFYIFKDYKSGLEYIRSGRALGEQGIYVELGAYQYHIFSDFREVCDDQQGHYARLTESLAGRGVSSMDEAYREMILWPVLYPFQQLVNPDMLRRLTEMCLKVSDSESITRLASTFFQERMEVLIREITLFTGAEDHVNEMVDYLNDLLLSIQRLKDIKTASSREGLKEYEPAASYLLSRLPLAYQDDLPSWRILLIWVITHRLGEVKGKAGYKEQSAAWFDEWLLEKMVIQALMNLGCDEDAARQETELVKLLVSNHDWIVPPAGQDKLSSLKAILRKPEVQQYLRFNWYKGVQWLNREALETLGYWLFVVAIARKLADTTIDQETVPAQIVARYTIIREFLQRAENSGYQTEKLL